MEKLDSAQLDQLKEIGAYLRQVRQEQSRSLEEIATKTCIRLPLLRAIELGQEQVLPEPVFVQGFIRRYADVLGLDGTSLARTFPVHTAIANREFAAHDDRNHTAEGGSRGSSEYPTSTIDSSTPSTLSSRFREFSNDSPSLLRSRGAYILYGLLGVLVLGGLLHGLLKPKPQPTASNGSSNTPSETLATTRRSPAASSSSPSPIASSPVRSPNPAASAGSGSRTSAPANNSGANTTGTSAAATNAPVTVNIKVTGDASWLEVIVDGERQLGETLTKGTQRSWSAQREIVVVSGNAGAVAIASNNSAAKTMGGLGEVKEMRFTPKSP